MENVVAAVFDVESEAFQVFTQIRQAPVGENYLVAEAALLKHEGDHLTLLDAFDTGVLTANDSAAGIIVGSLVGILGGPLGVLLGASVGALAGGVADTADALDSASAIEIVANKLFEGEVAIIALVQEEEPAFDAAFAQYPATVIRYDALDVIEEVDRARELQAEMQHQVAAQLRAERKAEASARREDRKEALKARFEELDEAAIAKHAESLRMGQ